MSQPPPIPITNSIGPPDFHAYPSPDDALFTRRAQWRRVIANSWRLHWSDVLLGVFYALIGLGRHAHPAGAPTHNLIWPFFLIGGVGLYLIWRLHGPEQLRESAVFYFNRPIRRSVLWDAQMAFVAFVTIGLEALLLFVNWAGPAWGLPGGHHVPPFAPLIPFLVMAGPVFCMDVLVYHGTNLIKKIFIGLARIIALLANAVFVILLACAGIGSEDEQCLLAWISLIVVGLIFWLSRRSWLKLQIGELR